MSDPKATSAPLSEPSHPKPDKPTVPVKGPAIRWTYESPQVHASSGCRLDPGEEYGLETMGEDRMAALVEAGSAEWTRKPAAKPKAPTEPPADQKPDDSHPPTPPRVAGGLPADFAASPITKSPGGNS